MNTESGYNYARDIAEPKLMNIVRTSYFNEYCNITLGNDYNDMHEHFDISMFDMNNSTSMFIDVKSIETRNYRKNNNVCISTHNMKFLDSLYHINQKLLDCYWFAIECYDSHTLDALDKFVLISANDALKIAEKSSSNGKEFYLLKFTEVLNSRSKRTIELDI